MYANSAICLLIGVLTSRVVLSYIDTYPRTAENATRKPLFFALITSFGGGFNSSHMIPGVQLALDRINQDPQMLPGYTLHYSLTDSQVCGCGMSSNALHALYSPTVQ